MTATGTVSVTDSLGLRLSYWHSHWLALLNVLCLQICVGVNCGSAQYTLNVTPRTSDTDSCWGHICFSNCILPSHGINSLLVVRVLSLLYHISYGMQDLSCEHVFSPFGLKVQQTYGIIHHSGLAVRCLFPCLKNCLGSKRRS